MFTFLSYVLRMLKIFNYLGQMDDKMHSDYKKCITILSIKPPVSVVGMKKSKKSMMPVNITTLSLRKLRIMKLCTIKLTKLSYRMSTVRFRIFISIMHMRLMTLSKMTLCIMTLRIITLTETKSRRVSSFYHYTECNDTGCWVTNFFIQFKKI